MTIRTTQYFLSLSLSLRLSLRLCLISPLSAQSNISYYFDFEELDVEVDAQGNIQSTIKHNHAEFQDAVPRYPQRTVVYGNKHSYKHAEFGNYPVGRLYLFHSPTWETPDKKGVSFNHVEVTLDSSLIPHSYYRISFLIANMKSHRYKPAHYGVKFSRDKIVKEGQGRLMSEPDVFFDFTNDDAFVEIQAILFFKEPVKYLYFGMFNEDSTRVPKKFTPMSDQISYSDTAAYYQYVKHTRVMLDNILLERLDTMHTTFRDIHYNLDDDQVRSPTDIAHIKAIVNSMKENPDTWLLIHGYADQSGTFLYNLDLSNRRAAHVKEILVGEGIDQRRIITIGRGKSPIDGDGSDSGYARKVSFLLLQSPN